ncbi:hypothetical protein B9Z55_028554 [Caenorhabditis nigoni]|uniref:Uncharacterized protein n=1 Tax=Caenorhabditis nigoni TaxID=1611254 RepID=A0A2G5SAX0_9PELO|nr:hypothetical protein B9Z55_028554 [Caenorhabditis nigoni]
MSYCEMGYVERSKKTEGSKNAEQPEQPKEPNVPKEKKEPKQRKASKKPKKNSTEARQRTAWAPKRLVNFIMCFNNFFNFFRMDAKAKTVTIKVDSIIHPVLVYADRGPLIVHLCYECRAFNALRKAKDIGSGKVDLPWVYAPFVVLI